MLLLAPWLASFLLLGQSIVASSATQRLFFDYCPADSEESWTYRGFKGPLFWFLIGYPNCLGLFQSPININSETVVKDENLAKLSLDNYDMPVSRTSMENNGHTIHAAPEDGVVRSITIEGSTYTLQQFHFHWGRNADQGSEHTLDGVQYAMELHFVHANEDGAYAVVGVIFQEGDESNPDLQPIVDALPELLYKENRTEINSTLNLNNLVQENPASYYRYQGSLTTPECTEGITWSVLTRLVNVGHDQMEEFRKLSSARKEVATEGCKLSYNYRPVQPLFGRQVFQSQ